MPDFPLICGMLQSLGPVNCGCCRALNMALHKNCRRLINTVCLAKTDTSKHSGTSAFGIFGSIGILRIVYWIEIIGTSHFVKLFMSQNSPSKGHTSIWIPQYWGWQVTLGQLCSSVFSKLIVADVNVWVGEEFMSSYSKNIRLTRHVYAQYSSCPRYWYVIEFCHELCGSY